MSMNFSDLPSAFDRSEEVNERLAGKKLAIFLDYDGTLTPIVDRPEMAILSESARTIVRGLAGRCSLAIVSGRDRPDVEKLVGIDNLIYAGSHGFDIMVPGGQAIQREEGAEFADVLEQVKVRLHDEVDGIEGSLIEPKKSSVAVHYRLVAPDQQAKIKTVVDAILADHETLRVTPGKMVYEIQPKLDWNKGKAVLWLLEALDLDKPDILPMYFGDDITDEDAFRALSGRGLGIFVGGATQEAKKDRPTDADYRVTDPDEAVRLLDTLAR
ncbi:MAG: trehalose-phosphatase [Rhodospirillales bacterium]|nr:trehalose-phosphatase [Rhodospirillales bacterium]